MSFLLLLVLLLCVACIAIGVVKKKASFLIAFGGSVLLYLVSCYAWFALQWFNVVRVDGLFKRLGLHRTGGVWGGLAFFGPPLLPVVIFNLLFIFIRRRKRKGAPLTIDPE